jgi:hypothetical protein
MKKKNQISLLASFWFVLIISVFWFLYIDTPESVMYARTGFLRWLPFILVFLVLPILLFKFINTVWENNSGWSIFVAAISVLAVGPTFGILSGEKQEKELRQNGEKVKGVVVNKWWAEKKGNDEWLFVCEYFVDGKAYQTFSIPDKDNKFRLGDSLEIIYSKSNPNNAVVAALSELGN